MGKTYGLLINPTNPSTYELVMGIVRPHLQREVGTAGSPSWYFGDWPELQICNSIVQMLIDAGIDHTTIFLKQGDNSTRGFWPVELTWQTGGKAAVHTRLEDAPLRAYFTWSANNETLQCEDYDQEALAILIQEKEQAGRDVPAGFREALKAQQSGLMMAGGEG